MTCLVCTDKALLMFSWVRILLIVTAIAGVVYILPFIWFFLLIAFGPDFCANQIYQEVYSADRTLKAVVFQRDCGATTGFSTQVSVLPAGETLGNDVAGNLYIANGRPADSRLLLQWTPQRSILIQGHVTDAIKQETMIEGVAVSYIQPVDH
jgi:hypothetical protein